MTATGYETLLAEARRGDGRLVVTEREGEHAVVRLNDPGSLNALSAPLTLQLQQALGELVADPHVRTIVLTGTDPGFCAGGDLRLMQQSVQPLVEHSAEGATAIWRWIRYQFGGIVRTIARSDKVFIAAVNGACAGVGLAFALGCDLVLASERARFLTAFGRIGLVPEVGTSWLLTRRLGYQRAFEVFVRGRVLAAAEAKELGLVNEVVAHDALLGRAREWAADVARLPEHAVTMAKPLLRAAVDMTWDHALTMEEFAEPMCFTTDAHREAVASLLRKSTS